MANHVFVETNWVVDIVAPFLSRDRDAHQLYEHAQHGDVVLHVPAICLVETRKVVRERKIRADFAAVRKFVRDRQASGRV